MRRIILLFMVMSCLIGKTFSQIKKYKGPIIKVIGSQIDGLILYDSVTDGYIAHVGGEDTIDLALLDKIVLGIRANTVPKFGGSVVFTLDDSIKKIDNFYPFSFGTKLPDQFFTPGIHIISAVPYTKQYATGSPGKKLTISLLVIDSDTSASESTPGTLTLTSAYDTAFNPTNLQLVFKLSGAEFMNDPSRHHLFVNHQKIAIPGITITPNELKISVQLAAGLNEIRFVGTDKNGMAASGLYSLWLGQNTLPVTVKNPQGNPEAGATVEVVLSDNTDVKVVGQTDVNGVVVFQNIPLRTLIITAKGTNNSFATAGIVGFGDPLTMNLKGFDTPSGIDNNDFAQGLQGWNIGTAPVTLIPHVEDPETAQSFVLKGQVNTLATDNDLQLTTSGEGPQSISRTFTVKSTQSTQGVIVKYKFITSEVPGGYYGSQYNDYFSVAIRNQTTGKVESAGKAMNSFAFSEFDGQGAITWRNLSLEASPGDIIKVDIEVANVGDGAFDSKVLIDNIGESELEIVSVDVKDIDNSKLNFLSLDEHTYFSNNTRVNGSFNIKGNSTSKLSKIELEVVKNNKVITRGNLNPNLQNQVYTTFGDDNLITVTNSSPLFLIPSANLNLGAGKVQLRLVATLESGESKTKDIKSVGIFTRFKFNDSRRFSGRDDNRGGDDWGEPTVVNFIQNTLPSDLFYNDCSNMNGGSFTPDHQEHQTGTDIDTRYTKAVPNPKRMNTADVAAKLINLLSSPAGNRIESVYLTFSKTNSDPFWIAIKDNPVAAKMIEMGGHEDHFHLNLIPGGGDANKISIPEFYRAAPRDIVTTKSTGKGQLKELSAKTVEVEKTTPKANTSLTIYPNPSSLISPIKIDAQLPAKGVAKLYVYDYAGRIAYQVNLTSANRLLHIELPGNIFKTKGVYFVSIRGNKINETRTIIIK